jgi:hypothetical protein
MNCPNTYKQSSRFLGDIEWLRILANANGATFEDPGTGQG